MKKLLLLLACFVVCGIVSLSAQTAKIVLKVGLEPIALIPSVQPGTFDIDVDTLNVICMGIDADWNGVFDEGTGDQLPSWWKICGIKRSNYEESHPTAYKVMDFDASCWNTFFPFRFPQIKESAGVPALHANILSIPTGDGIEFYDIQKETKLEQFVSVKNAKSMALLGNAVVVSRNEYDNGSYTSAASYVDIYLKHDMQLVKSIKLDGAGLNVQRVVCYETPTTHKQVIAVLCEGTFPGGEGQIHFIVTDGIQDDDITYTTNVVKVGADLSDMIQVRATYMGIDANVIFAVSSFDNKVYVVLGDDIPGQMSVTNFQMAPEEPQDMLRTMSFQNTGYDATQYCGYAASYDGNLYYLPYGLNVNAIREIEGEGGWIEAVYAYEGMEDEPTQLRLKAAFTTFLNDNYEPQDKVTLLYHMDWSSISETQNNEFKVYPNPATNGTFAISTDKQAESIEILSLDGKKVASFDKPQLNTSFTKFLSKGAYFIKVDFINQASQIQKIVVSE